MPLAEGLEYSDDLPHTISTAIVTRIRIDSLNELPEDKRPPRDLWWKPFKLKQFLDEVFDTKKEGASRKFIELNFEEAE
jgi:hypothetical protein